MNWINKKLYKISHSNDWVIQILWVILVGSFQSFFVLATIAALTLWLAK